MTRDLPHCCQPLPQRPGLRAINCSASVTPNCLKPQSGDAPFHFACANRGQTVSARGDCQCSSLGACAALALHAHPTAVLLSPWLMAALVAVPRPHRPTAAVAAMIGGGLIFLPLILAHWMPGLAGDSVAINAPGVSGLGGTPSAASRRCW